MMKNNSLTDCCRTCDVFCMCSFIAFLFISSGSRDVSNVSVDLVQVLFPMGLPRHLSGSACCHPCPRGIALSIHCAVPGDNCMEIMFPGFGTTALATGAGRPIIPVRYSDDMAAIFTAVAFHYFRFALNIFRSFRTRLFTSSVLARITFSTPYLCLM